MKRRHKVQGNKASHKQPPRPAKGPASVPMEAFGTVDPRLIEAELEALEAQARPPGLLTTVRKRLGLQFSARLVFVGGFLALVAFGVSAQWDRLQRTATAPIIVDGSTTHLEEHPAIQAGRTVRYSFVVNGVEYSGMASVNWGSATVRAAKVCYDPADPRNSGLVKAGESCP